MRQADDAEWRLGVDVVLIALIIVWALVLGANASVAPSSSPSDF